MAALCIVAWFSSSSTAACICAYSARLPGALPRMPRLFSFSLPLFLLIFPARASIYLENKNTHSVTCCFPCNFRHRRGWGAAECTGCVVVMSGRCPLCHTGPVASLSALRVCWVPNSFQTPRLPSAVPLVRHSHRHATPAVGSTCHRLACKPSVCGTACKRRCDSCLFGVPKPPS